MLDSRQGYRVLSITPRPGYSGAYPLSEVLSWGEVDHSPASNAKALYLVEPISIHGVMLNNFLAFLTGVMDMFQNVAKSPFLRKICHDIM
jgi:hypothetical protein